MRAAAAGTNDAMHWHKDFVYETFRKLVHEPTLQVLDIRTISPVLPHPSSALEGFNGMMFAGGVRHAGEATWISRVCTGECLAAPYISAVALGTVREKESASELEWTTSMKIPVSHSDHGHCSGPEDPRLDLVQGKRFFLASINADTATGGCGEELRRQIFVAIDHEAGPAQCMVEVEDDPSLEQCSPQKNWVPLVPEGSDDIFFVYSLMPLQVMILDRWTCSASLTTPGRVRVPDLSQVRSGTRYVRGLAVAEGIIYVSFAHTPPLEYKAVLSAILVKDDRTRADRFELIGISCGFDIPGTLRGDQLFFYINGIMDFDLEDDRMNITLHIDDIENQLVTVRGVASWLKEAYKTWRSSGAFHCGSQRQLSNIPSINITNTTNSTNATTTTTAAAIMDTSDTNDTDATTNMTKDIEDVDTTVTTTTTTTTSTTTTTTATATHKNAAKTTTEIMTTTTDKIDANTQSTTAIATTNDGVRNPVDATSTATTTSTPDSDDSNSNESSETTTSSTGRASSLRQTRFDAVFALDDVTAFDTNKFLISVAEAAGLDVSQVEIVNLVYLVQVEFFTSEDIPRDVAISIMSDTAGANLSNLEINVTFRDSRRLSAGWRVATQAVATIETPDASAVPGIAVRAGDSALLTEVLSDRGFDANVTVAQEPTTLVKVTTHLTSLSTLAISAPDDGDLSDRLSENFNFTIKASIRDVTEVLLTTTSTTSTTSTTTTTSTSTTTGTTTSTTSTTSTTRTTPKTTTTVLQSEILIAGSLWLVVENSGLFVDDPKVARGIEAAIAKLIDIDASGVAVFFEVLRRRLASRRMNAEVVKASVIVKFLAPADQAVRIGQNTLTTLVGVDSGGFTNVILAELANLVDESVYSSMLVTKLRWDEEATISVPGSNSDPVQVVAQTTTTPASIFEESGCERQSCMLAASLCIVFLHLKLLITQGLP